MTFHEFEDGIKDTLAKYIRDKAQKERYVELILGLYEEGAEVTSIIRRSIPGNFHETQIDLTHLEEELGDIIWYISQIRMQLHSDNKFNAEEISLEEYQKNVIAKNKEDKHIPKSQMEKGRYFSMGLIKEIGEISTIFGDSLINGVQLNQERVEEKLDDSVLYLASIADNYGLDLEQIAMKSLQKAKSRYNKNGIAQIPKTEEGR